MVKSFLTLEIICWSIERGSVGWRLKKLELFKDVVFEVSWVSRSIVQDEKGLQGGLFSWRYYLTSGPQTIFTYSTKNCLVTHTLMFAAHITCSFSVTITVVYPNCNP